MSLGPPAGFRPVERKPVRTKVQQNEIPPERQPARKKTQQNEKPNLNRFTIDFVLKQSLLRLLTLPLRHNNNGKKNSQISTAPYGNNFTGAAGTVSTQAVDVSVMSPPSKGRSGGISF